MTAFKLIYRFYKLLDRKRRIQLFKQQIVLILVALADLTGISLVLPFMAVVAGSKTTTESMYYLKLIEFIKPDSTAQLTTILGTIVVIALVLTTTLNLINTWYTNHVAFQMGGWVSIKLFENFLSRDYLFHTAKNSSELVTKIMNESQRIAFKIIQPLLMAISRVFLILFISIAVVYMEPQIALIAVGVFALVYLGIFQLIKIALKRNSKIESVENEIRMKILNESLGGIKEVKLMALEANFADQFASKTNKYFRAVSQTNFIAVAPKYLIESLAFSMIVVVTLVFQEQQTGFSEIVPKLSFFAFAGYKLMPGMQQIFSSISSIRGAMTALEDVLLDLEVTNTSTFPIKLQAPALPSTPFPKPSSLRFENVSFQYPGSPKPALRSLNLLISGGSSFGIVGESGAGKSTFIDILLGLITPTQGIIYVDDKPLTASSLRSWQEKIGYVPQAIFLTDDSILSNICFGSSIDEIRAWEALRIAHLEDYIKSLPAGIHTRVGERGVQLSGGQRQRIGIARAIYRNPQIVVFDEATSALDSNTETEVIEAIRELSTSRTIVMVAHRIPTLRYCDHILVFSNGEIAAQKSYQNLVSSVDP